MSNLIGKLFKPLVLAGALSLASLVGCTQPGAPTPPTPPTSPSGTKPATPSLSLIPEAIEPNRIMQLLIQDYNFDENNVTIQKLVGGVYNTLATVTLDQYGEGVYNDRGLSTSTAYTYRIKANNNAGSSDWNQQIATSPGTQSGTKTLSPTQDSYVTVGSPYSNYGNFSQLLILGGATTSFAEAYVQFPYNQISYATSIASATLSLTSPSVEYLYPVGYPPYISVDSLATDWSESTVTWNTRPLFRGDVSSSAYVYDNGQVVNWDVTPILQNWLQGTTLNHGLRLSKQLLIHDGEAVLDSRESSYPPRLIINYTW